jgi:hypothetical protein|tara:strand:+ start:45 stop:776 length:732 start_codon:yes stop_codon:yes gene_type:complete
MSEFKFPTETVDLPSKGLVYPKDHPLSSGKVEVKYMTAKEEDILTNQSYINKGTVLDKLLQSVIVDKINVDDLVVGDKNAVFVATRILGYGKNYEFTVNNQKQSVDLTEIDNKEFDPKTLIEENKNEFAFTLPHSDIEITYKILNGKDEKKINREISGLKKINKEASPELSTRLKYLITSVDGKDESKDIREFVDNYLLAIDSRALRDHIKETQPDVDLVAQLDSGEEVRVPIGLNFFWPDVG